MYVFAKVLFGSGENSARLARHAISDFLLECHSFPEKEPPDCQYGYSFGSSIHKDNDNPFVSCAYPFALTVLSVTPVRRTRVQYSPLSFATPWPSDPHFHALPF